MYLWSGACYASCSKQIQDPLPAVPFPGLAHLKKHTGDKNVYVVRSTVLDSNRLVESYWRNGCAGFGILSNGLGSGRIIFGDRSGSRPLLNR